MGSGPYFLWPQIHPVYEKQKLDLATYEVVENIFSRLYPSFFPVLFSSGRSAIFSILEHIDAKRSDYIGIPQFSSHCVIELIGRLSMPTNDYSLSLKAALNYHQWGYSKKIKTQFHSSTVIIEDSCDSLVIDESALFINNGLFEVFSLPKILGTTFGGLVICRDKLQAGNLMEIRDSKDKEMALIQFWLKTKSLQRKKKYEIYSEYWNSSEAVNGNLPAIAVQQIARYTGDISKIVDQRKYRIERLIQSGLSLLVGFESFDNNRLPVVVPTVINDVQSNNLVKHGFTPFIRNFNVSSFVDDSDYHRCFPFPIHQQVTDEDFETIIEILGA